MILMGVSGSGKTTVGTHLAEKLGWTFVDGDKFHPECNVEKMGRGEPLTDADRLPWLQSIHRFISKRLASNAPAIVACSALKASYRKLLLEDNDGAHLVYLRGDYDLIQERLKKREDHFFDPQLLDSQFDTLEAPTPDEAVIVDIDAPVETIVRRIQDTLPQGASASE